MAAAVVGLEVAGGVDEVVAFLGMEASRVNPCSVQFGQAVVALHCTIVYYDCSAAGDLLLPTLQLTRPLRGLQMLL